MRKGQHEWRGTRRFRARLSPAMVVACIALGVALSGTGYAVTALPRNSVGTPQLKANAVNSAEVKNRSLRAVDFAAGQLPAGAQGPPGAQGPQGPQGPAGAQGAKGDPGTPATALWTRVTTFFGGSCCFTRHGTATAVSHVSGGRYTVTFDRSVQDCGIQVTSNAGVNGGHSTGTQRLVAHSYGPTAQTVNVTFLDHAGTETYPLGFSLAVFC